MNIFDKLVGAIRIEGDEGDEYDGGEDFENEESDYEEEKPSKKVEESHVVKPFEKPFEKKQTSPSTPKNRSTISMNDSSVHVFKPTSFEEAKNIAETLIEGNTILLNFENVDVAVSQRVIDIVTGTCIAIKGNIQRISNYIFIATPSTVDVLGTATETLAGSFDSL